MSQASFQKQQREKARRAKAAAKWARREERRSGDPSSEAPAVPEADQATVLAELAALHERFDAGLIEFEDFAAAKQELTERLTVR